MKGVNDESFNQSAWKGFQDAQESLGKDKLEIKYLESKQDADYIQNIDNAINHLNIASLKGVVEANYYLGKIYFKNKLFWRIYIKP